MKIERRAFKIEVREDGDGSKILAGTPIVYDKRSEDLGFYEFIGGGAATDALKRSDPRLLYGHNSDTLLPIARQKSGTLRSREDKNGVHIEADPPKFNPFVTAFMESIERGDVGEMSFGFTVEDDEWQDLDKDRPTRTIRKIGEIFDYSYVAFAAYNDTSVALRSLKKAKAAVEDKPAFSEPMVTITYGEETKEFSLNDKGEINRWLEGLTGEEEPEGDPEPEEKRSELKPTLPDSDIAVDEPTLDKPTDATKVMERWNEKLTKYERG